MLQQFNQSFDNLIEKLSRWVDSLILLLPNIILAIFVLLIFILIARRLKKMTRRLLQKSSANRTVIGFLSNGIVAVFMLIALFVILSILNLGDAVTALLGTAGVAGLAIGLALQGPLVNLFSGVLMSVKDYYRVGDLVETNGFFGKIQKINLRSTIIMTPDGQEVVIPNKDVLENPLKNYSHTKMRRIDIECGVSFGDNLEKVKQVVLDTIKNSDLKLSEFRPIQFYFTEFGSSSINFVLRFWQDISEQSEYLAAKDQAIILIKKAFDENGITIPFPIRTLDFGIVGGMRLDEIYPPGKMAMKDQGKENSE